MKLSEQYIEKYKKMFFEGGYCLELDDLDDLMEIVAIESQLFLVEKLLIEGFEIEGLKVKLEGYLNDIRIDLGL